MTMGVWGTHFERTVTWWRQGKDFITYLARVQCLLQAGESVADRLMTTGTETPDVAADVAWCHRRYAEGSRRTSSPAASATAPSS